MLTYSTAKIPKICCEQINTDLTDCDNVYVWKKKRLIAKYGCVNVIKKVYYITSAIAVTFACFQALTLKIGAFFYQLINGPLSYPKTPYNPKFQEHERNASLRKIKKINKT